jgi:hypothetical protein
MGPATAPVVPAKARKARLIRIVFIEISVLVIG